MSKRDALDNAAMRAFNCDAPCRSPPCGCAQRARLDILALLADPDDRMVEAAHRALMELGYDHDDVMLKAAIRAAMQAAGE